MLISGWGNYPKLEAKVITAESIKDIKENLDNRLIARGMGRSYGDSANAKVVIGTNKINKIINFDDEIGLITVESGATIRNILELIVPSGWFFPVTSGTSRVTIGGAISSDIHGKNHHNAGTITEYLIEMNILIGNGQIINCSKEKNVDLFYATCGGMGLTGIITSAVIKLKKIKSYIINERQIKTKTIDETFNKLEEFNNSSYSVAWIDLLTNKKYLGRGIVSLGEHSEEKNLNFKLKKTINIPYYTPSVFISKNIIKAFNFFYYNKPLIEYKNISLEKYFYPLDTIDNWNRIYGKNGFVQYQFQLPLLDCLKNLKLIINKIYESKAYVTLGVLKKFGKANKNLLSFPDEGFTLALDFKMSKNTLHLIRELDEIILSMSGRVYLTKDATLTESTFKKMYKNWSEFENIRSKYFAIGKFESSQSIRLGLK